MQNDCEHFLQKKENISPNTKNCKNMKKSSYQQWHFECVLHVDM